MNKNIVYILLGLAFFFLSSCGDKQKKINEFFPEAQLEKLEKLSDEDFNMVLKSVDGVEVNLNQFKGKKIFLNFWGTWCPPCIEEWPSIQKLYDKQKNNAVFVLIAMQDKEEKVKEFLKKNNYNVPVYFAQSLISKNIMPKSFPTTFLIDQEGKIIKKEDASIDWNTQEIHQIIMRK